MCEGEILFLERDSFNLSLANNQLVLQTNLLDSQLHQTYVFGSFLYGVGRYKTSGPTTEKAIYFKSYLPYLKDINSATLSFGASALTLGEIPTT